MDSVNLDLNDFFIKGYIHGKFFESIDEFYNFDFPNCEDPNIGETDSTPKEAASSLGYLQEQIAQKLIYKIFPDFEHRNYGMWEGVDEGSATWHNDWEDGKNMNTNVLVYLDNAGEHNNSIQVRNKNDEFIILPKAGDFVWLNQSKGFQHKASHNDGRRRVLSFEYFANGLNN
mgnify:CR=1 FL=1